MTKAEAIQNLEVAGNELNEAIEDLNDRAASISEVSDYDFGYDADSVDEDAIDALERDMPDDFDLYSLIGAAKAVQEARGRYESALYDLRDALDTEYEVVVIFTVEAGSEAEAEDKVQSALGRHVSNMTPPYTIEEVREA